MLDLHPSAPLWSLWRFIFFFLGKELGGLDPIDPSILHCRCPPSPSSPRCPFLPALGLTCTRTCLCDSPLFPGACLPQFTVAPFPEKELNKRPLQSFFFYPASPHLLPLQKPPPPTQTHHNFFLLLPLHHQQLPFARQQSAFHLPPRATQLHLLHLFSLPSHTFTFTKAFLNHNGSPH